jgi:hypothetical protein
VSLRSFACAWAVTATLSACGGRAAVSGSDEPAGGCAFDCDGPMSAAGATAQAGAGGSLHAAGSGGEGEPEPGGAAGSAGAAETGGAAAQSEGDAGNAAGASAGAGGACAHSQGRFATDVLSHSFGGGQNFNQAAGFPQAMLGPPAAGDPSSLVSLGNGGWVVLGFAGNAIVDGPGVDFTVFENPLPSFKELATVAVSDDAQHWTEFPCSAAQDASDYGFCAGVGVVYSSPNNGIDPLDPAVSGGDHYDLAAIGATHARYVRITDRADLTGTAGVFDLDAVAIVHAECP